MVVFGVDFAVMYELNSGINARKQLMGYGF